MMSRIQKWGNGLVLRIPKPLAAELGLQENSLVDLGLCQGRLIVTPSPKPALNLDDLLAKVTKKNLHGADVWGGVL